jgi:predicted N-acetyltransferase YhbS
MTAQRSTGPTESAPITVRAMRAADLDAVVDLDARVLGAPRGASFEGRLAALGRGGAADRTIALVAESAGSVVGLVMGTLTHGEFGFAQATALVDSIAVDPARQRRGIGHQLAAAFLEESAARGAYDVYTLVSWNAWDLLRFFDSLGFALATTVPLRRPID